MGDDKKSLLVFLVCLIIGGSILYSALINKTNNAASLNNISNPNNTPPTANTNNANNTAAPNTENNQDNSLNNTNNVNNTVNPNNISPVNNTPAQAQTNNPPARVVEPAVSGSDFVYTSNYANPKLVYYYYFPERLLKLNKKVPFLIMIPGYCGKGEDIINKQVKDFAMKEGFVVISPTFVPDDNNCENDTNYQRPAGWSGAALDKIIETFELKQHLYHSNFYMWGFSAGAQFDSGYAKLHPGRLKGCMVNSAGYVALPEGYQSTKFFVAVGTSDLDYRKDAAKSFYEAAKNFGIDVIYKEYNMGHTFCYDELNDEFNFIKSIENKH